MRQKWEEGSKDWFVKLQAVAQWHHISQIGMKFVELDYHMFDQTVMSEQAFTMVFIIYITVLKLL